MDGFTIRFLLAFIVGGILTVLICMKLSKVMYKANKYYWLVGTLVITACLAIFCGLG